MQRWQHSTSGLSRSWTRRLVLVLLTTFVFHDATTTANTGTDEEAPPPITSDSSSTQSRSPKIVEAVNKEGELRLSAERVRNLLAHRHKTGAQRRHLKKKDNDACTSQGGDCVTCHGYKKGSVYWNDFVA